MILLSFLISRGERPRAPCGATCGDKPMGDANRVLPRSHKSAEPIKAGRAGTFGPARGLASEPVMARETEPMADASLHVDTCQSRQVGSWRESRTCGVLIRVVNTWTGGARRAARQPRYELARYRGQNPHGVKSAPKTGERSDTEPKNLAVASGIVGPRMAEATSDRDGEGRSLRSSPRAGKPSTWRRKAVDTVGRQEVGLCPTR
ncbi:hypothetical protein SPHS8_01909 [Sphingobium sp. S8]|nr:hypothetical protein SPHS8_01909 [Sphingobium sp. S8]